MHGLGWLKYQAHAKWIQKIGVVLGWENPCFVQMRVLVTVATLLLRCLPVWSCIYIL